MSCEEFYSSIRRDDDRNTKETSYTIRDAAEFPSGSVYLVLALRTQAIVRRSESPTSEPSKNDILSIVVLYLRSKKRNRTMTRLSCHLGVAVSSRQPTTAAPNDVYRQCRCRCRCRCFLSSRSSSRQRKCWNKVVQDGVCYHQRLNADNPYSSSWWGGRDEGCRKSCA